MRLPVGRHRVEIVGRQTLGLLVTDQASPTGKKWEKSVDCTTRAFPLTRERDQASHGLAGADRDGDRQ
jgi:hypothetical protein